MSTLYWLGWPSSSMPIAPHSVLIVPSSTSVTSGEATSSPALPRYTTRSLGDQVGLEAVTARLVEQHAAAAALDDHRQRPAGRRAGVELGDRHAGRVAGELLHVDRSNISKPTVWPALWKPVCMPASPLATTLIRNEAAHLLVLGEHAVGVGDEDAACGCRRSRPTPARSPHRPSGRVVDPPEQFDLAALGTSSGYLLTVLTLGRVAAGERDRAHAAAALAGGRGGRRGRGQQARLAEVGGVREAGGVALHHADAGTAIAAAGDLFDPSVVESGRGGPLVLGEHLRELGPVAHRSAEHLGEHVLVDHLSEPTERPCATGSVRSGGSP
jgi:hypothetical protein